MDLSRWKSGWAVAALSVVAVALIAFFLSLGDDSRTPSSASPQLVAAQDLTSQVRMEVSDPQLDSGAGRYYVHAIVTNRGNKPLVGPIVVSPYAGLRVADPDGQFESGNDYVTLVPEGKRLEPGERIQSRRIALRDGKQDRRTAKNFRVWRGLALGGSSVGGVVAALPAPAVNVGGPATGAVQPIPLPPNPFPTPDQRVVNRVMAVQNSWTPRLLSVGGVHGTGTGLTPEGEVVVRVHVEDQSVVANLPQQIDGVRVEVSVGPRPQFRFQPPPQNKLGQGGFPSPRPNTSDPQIRWARPVPIGVSGIQTADTGFTLFGCASGTIGARVRGRDGKLYALSNNHVFADFNQASIGDPIYQPSPGDNNCNADPNNVIGTLADFEPYRPASFIFPLPNGEVIHDVANVMDAAIAEVTEATLSNATPPSGYGLPNSSPVAPVLGMKVEKFGRTTRLQTGFIVGVNETIFIGADIGNGFVEPIVFVNQIEIIHTDPAFRNFSQGGDSGSLIVTAYPNLNPVGLLFAGGLRLYPRLGIIADATLANPIGPVLERFNVTIDGAPSNLGPAGR